MTIHIVLNVVKLLNFFSNERGVSDTISPKTIMSGETLDYKKHMSLQLGQHCQVHEEDNPRNSQIARTKGAIYLGPSGNLQGGFKFMALNSGKKIVRRSWDVIPMPDLLIDRANTLGRDQPQHMTFTDIDDLDIHHADPAPIEVAPTQEEPRTETPAPVALPAQAPDLRRSTRVRSQKNQVYTPSLSGSKYSYPVTQLENQGVLNPDSHMFVQDNCYQAEPDAVAAIMTQLSLKAGLE
jgi:hypothetical protein